MSNAAEPIQVSSIENFFDKFKSTGLDHSVFMPMYGLAEATLAVSATIAEHYHAVQISRYSYECEQRAVDADSAETEIMSIVSCGPIFDEMEVCSVRPVKSHSYSRFASCATVRLCLTTRSERYGLPVLPNHKHTGKTQRRQQKSSTLLSHPGLESLSCGLAMLDLCAKSSCISVGGQRISSSCEVATSGLKTSKKVLS